MTNSQITALAEQMKIFAEVMAKTERGKLRPFYVRENPDGESIDVRELDGSATLIAHFRGPSRCSDLGLWLNAFVLRSI